MSIFYYCHNCDTIYGSFFKADESSYSTPCPKVDCCGQVFEVDELMLPTIRLLNLKGYMTDFCCSGHWTEHYVSSYVKFYELDEDTKDYLQSNLPDPWYFDEDAIRVNNDYFSESTPLDKFIKLCEVNILLYKWAEELKDIEEY